MTILDWSPTGLGLASISCAALLMFLFRKKTFGYFDPLSIYLATRTAPTLGSILLIFSIDAIYSYFFLLTLGSVLIFIATLYLSTPKLNIAVTSLSDRCINDLSRLAIALTIAKFSILFSSTGSLPIFGGSGSDSFIEFAEDNKVGTSFLFAIGSAELVLLSLVIPATKGFKRMFVLLALITSALMHLAGGKKSSLLSILFALALGEYLRMHFTNYKNRFFTNRKTVSLMAIVAILWAWLIFEKTSGSIDFPEANALATLLDFIFLQWAYPTFLFSSGELSGFFNGYHVNKIIYFFHTVFSPLGFPAFDASIGPSLTEYQTGQLTGNGINPTFILEGYMLFGVLLPLYSLLAALFIGRFRAHITNLRHPKIKVLFCSLLLPPIYIFPVDALLFMKILISLLLLSPGVMLLSGMLKR